LVAIELNEGAVLAALISTMLGAFVALTLGYLAFRVSLESRLKDLEHQIEALQLQFYDLDCSNCFIETEDAHGRD
jgi:membrane protein YqaA with SNARE-associated domain